MPAVLTLPQHRPNDKGVQDRGSAWRIIAFWSCDTTDVCGRQPTNEVSWMTIISSTTASYIMPHIQLVRELLHLEAKRSLS
jgi:hypothetical protein